MKKKNISLTFKDDLFLQIHNISFKLFKTKIYTMYLQIRLKEVILIL